MSEKPPILQPGMEDAQPEQAELDLRQSYLDARSAALNLYGASTISTQESIDSITAVGRRYQYAAPDDEGVLVLNVHGVSSDDATEDIGKKAIEYQASIDRIISRGYLDPEASTAYRRTFSVDTIDTRLPMHSMMFFNVLDDPIRMHLGDKGTSTRDTFHSLAADCVLDERATAMLDDVADRKENLEANPNYGSNFLYKYSEPFLEIGKDKDKDELKARLGVIHTRLNDGAGLDHVDFSGVYLPVDKALDIIGGGIDSYVRLAEPEKARALEAPRARELHQDIMDSREASAIDFAAQLRQQAPETSIVSDTELLSLVKTAAEYRTGVYGSSHEANPIAKHIMDVARSKNAAFGGIAHKDNPNQLAKDRSEQPRFWEPTSVLEADGLTGLVTRADFEERPWQPGGMSSSKEEIGRVVYDADKSALMRRQMAAIRMETEQPPMQIDKN